MGFLGALVVRKLPASARLGRSPGGGNDNPLQYSCLENPMDRGTWWATIHGLAESDTTEQLTLSLLPLFCAGHKWGAKTDFVPLVASGFLVLSLE